MRALVTSDSSSHRNAVICGALTILLPSVSTDLLAIVLFAFILSERRSMHAGPLNGWLPFLLICSAWSAGELFAAVDAQVLKEIWHSFPSRAAAFLAEFRWFRSSNASGIRAGGTTIRFAAFLGTMALLQPRAALRKSMLNGVVLGLALALPVTIVQLVLRQRGIALHDYFPRQSLYWDRIGRIPATFSDPNAFGIALALVLPLLAVHVSTMTSSLRKLGYAFIGVWIFLALYSGSRTFILLCFISLAVLVIRRLATFVSFLLIAVTVVVALNCYPEVVHVAVMPESVRRTLQSLVASNWHEVYFSRLLFLRLIGEVLLSNPWFGSGLGTFRNFVVPLTADLPGVIPLWSDNPNSFYLGILAETGVFGFAALLFGIGSLRFRADASPLLRATTVGFLVVLFFGPHLDFVEVVALAALLCASVVEFRERERGSLALVAACCLLPFILTFADFTEQGFYPWERDGAWYFRWTERRAQGYTQCREGRGRLLLRAPRPRHQDGQTDVSITSADFPEQRVTLKGDAVTPVTLACDSADVSRPLFYTLVSSSLMRPITNPTNEKSNVDYRALGVQVVTKHPLESLP